MREAKDIAKDLAEAQNLYRGWQATNAAGLTADELACVTARGMELSRRVFLLEREKREWVERP